MLFSARVIFSMRCSGGMGEESKFAVELLAQCSGQLGGEEPTTLFFISGTALNIHFVVQQSCQR